jgi:tetratricopeptide (TPR) repeat protein
MKFGNGKIAAICTTTILTMSLMGCQQERKAPLLSSTDVLVRSLPIGNPDTTVARLAEYQIAPAQLHKVYQQIAWQSLDSFPPNIVLQHLQAYETLCAGDSSAHAFAQLIRGELYTDQGQYDAAILVLTDGRYISQRLQNKELEGDICRKIADNYTRQAEYGKATEMLYYTMDCFGDSIPADKKLGCLNDLAVNFQLQGDAARARSIFEEVVHTAQKKGAKLSSVYGMLGILNVLSDLHQPDSTILVARQTLAAIRSDAHPENPALEALTIRWLGKAYTQKGAWITALQHLNQADTLLAQAGKESVRVHVWLNQAECYRALKSYDRALSVFQQIQKHRNYRDDLALQIRVHDALALLYESANQTRQALHHLTTARSITDSLRIKERAKTIEQLNLRFEGVQQAQRLLMLEQSNKIANLRIATILTLLLLMLFVFAFSGYRNRLRQKLLRAENQLLTARDLETHSKLKALEIFTRSLINKNRRLTDQEESSGTVATALHTDAPAPMVSMPVQMKILTEEDWRTYQYYFEQAYHGFIHKVQDRFSNLTQAELRLVLLIKQGYDTREIADLLGISIAGAKKTRYRLRKKIGLEETDNLDAFVQQL